MKARCVNSFFTQNVSGTQGQIIDIDDNQTLEQLVEAGYVEQVESSQQTAKTGAKSKKVNGANEGK